MVVKVKLYDKKEIHERDVLNCYVRDGFLHIVKSLKTLSFPMSEVKSCVTNTRSMIVR